MKYTVTLKANRKNAKRHFAGISTYDHWKNTIEEARAFAEHYKGGKYIVEIYNSKWELVEVIK